MTEPLIHMEHVSKFYQLVIGVGDIHISLPHGTYGLIGPNGSGKTTFLNLITGMLRPSIGSLRVFGIDPGKKRQVLRRIGFCPASDILIPNVSALQWVEHMTALHGFAREEASGRAVESLRRVGMEPHMDEPIGTFSLGMRQRVKLAQASAHDPDLLILDEPFNGLDPIGRHELSRYLQEWSAAGRSLILASHILHEVEAVTSSFLLIHGGRILANGDARDVRGMLVGFPIEVELRGEGLERVAAQLAAHSWLAGLRFSDGRHCLTVQVDDRAEFCLALGKLAVSEGVRIEAMQSTDGTLEAAFDLLLKAHRGEYVGPRPATSPALDDRESSS